MIAKLTICLTLALLISTPISAKEMGRLFYSPEQRAQLNDSQLNGDSPKDTSNAVVLNGIVQRHGGKRTAWINGVAEVVGRSSERSPASISVTIPGKAAPQNIKVGQTITITPSNSD